MARRRFKTLEDIRRYLANVLDRLEAKELDGVEAKVRAYIAQVLAGIVKDSDLESRVLELEERFSKEAPHVRQ